jgi:hypothetical protein
MTTSLYRDPAPGSTRKRPTGASAPLLSTLTGLSLVVVCPIIVIASTANFPGWPFAGPLVVTAVSGARFAWIVGSSKRRLFEMVVWLFCYVFLGIAPLIQLRTGQDPGTTPGIDHAFDWTASWVALAGCLSIMAGSSLAGRTFPLRGRPPQETEPVQRPARVSPTRVTLLSIVSLMAATYYVAKVGVVPLFAGRFPLIDAQQAAWPDSTVSAVVVASISMGLLVAFIAQLHITRQERLAGRRIFSPLQWMTGLALFACVNPISSPRYVFGTVILAVLTALGVCATLRLFRCVALASLAGIVFVFPLADYFRAGAGLAADKGDTMTSLTTGDFDAFAQINNTVHYVTENGLTQGRQALGVLLFWVPRGIWPDKPVDTGILLAEWRHYGFTNLSATLWTELFINGGWVLLIVGMGVFGWFLRRWDATAEDELASKAGPSLLVCIVPYYLLIMLRGSLLQSMAYLTVMLLAVLWVARKARSRDPSAPGQQFMR